jgi:hypothetical protein
VPLQLLPGAMFGLRYLFVIVAGEKTHIGITQRKLCCIIDVIGYTQPYDGLRKIIGKIFFGPQMQIRPAAPFIAETGLVKIPKP